MAAKNREEGDGLNRPSVRWFLLLFMMGHSRGSSSGGCSLLALFLLYTVEIVSARCSKHEEEGEEEEEKILRPSCVCWGKGGTRDMRSGRGFSPFPFLQPIREREKSHKNTGERFLLGFLK